MASLTTQQLVDHETLTMVFYAVLRELGLKTNHAPSAQQILCWVDLYGYDFTVSTVTTFADYGAACDHSLLLSRGTSVNMDAEESTRRESERGLDCYDPEGRVFPVIAKKVSDGQRITKLDVLLILKWKLNFVKGSYSETVSDANMDKINRAIRDAGEQGKELEAIESLVTIPEIKLAAATAILTVCFPHKFTILDFRVLRTLNLFPSGLAPGKRTKHSTKDWKAKDYLNEYLPAVQRRREEWQSSLRDADKALWGLSVARQIEVVITNS